MRTRLALLLCLLATPALAETITFNYTEVVASGGKTLAYSTVYWCRGATCTNWTNASKQLSDNGAGGDAKAIPVSIPLTAGTLPLTIRFRVTMTDTTGNETAGAFTTHTFSP